MVGPAPFVIAGVDAVPEELVDQIAVGAVDLDGVEADFLRRAGRAAEGGDGVGDVLVGHGLVLRLAGAGHARGAVDLAQRLPLSALTPGRADVPDLGRDQATDGVDLVHHLAPFRQGLAVEDRNSRVVAGRRTLDHRALGDDQAHPALGAAAVVTGHALGRDAARREGPGHRRHDDAIGQRQPLDGEGTEQGVDGHGRFSERLEPTRWRLKFRLKTLRGRVFR
jgi:hypothetical protein